MGVGVGVGVAKTVGVKRVGTLRSFEACFSRMGEAKFYSVELQLTVGFKKKEPLKSDKRKTKTTGWASVVRGCRLRTDR